MEKEEFGVQIKVGEGVMVGTRGRGLFAGKDYSAQEEIFREAPVAVMQSNKAECLSCGHCCRFVGTLGQQALVGMQVLSRQEVEQEGVLDDDLGEPGTSVASLPRCPLACGEVYCSQECLEHATRFGHEILCAGRSPDMEHPIINFKLHALEHFESFLLSGILFAKMVMEKLCSPSTSWETIWEPVGALVPHEALVWELLHEDENLKTQCAISCSLLVQVLESYPQVESSGIDVKAFVSDVRFGQVVAKFLQNNFGIRFPSPLTTRVQLSSANLQDTWLEKLTAFVHNHSTEDCDSCEEHEHSENEQEEEEDCDSCEEHEHIENSQEEDEEYDDEGQGEEDGLSNLRDDLIEDPASFFPPADGEGLFLKGCVMNHSCNPNVRVVYPFGCSTACIEALRPVATGEELLHDYAIHVEDREGQDDRSKAEERRKALAQYGIECSCNKCDPSHQ